MMLWTGSTGCKVWSMDGHRRNGKTRIGETGTHFFTHIFNAQLAETERFKLLELSA